MGVSQGVVRDADCFVGRERELELLEDRLGAARRGRFQLVAIEGPAGIGKTSLVRHFVGPRSSPAGRVLWASGDEEEVRLPWGVLSQLAASALAAGSPQLMQLVEGLDPEADGALVGAGLLRLLADDDPLVVVLDDIHWADAQSLAAVRFALRRLMSEKVMAVVVYRPEFWARLGEGWRRLLAGSEGASRFRLEGLRAPDLVELSRVVCGRPLSIGAAARVLEQTDGHPIFIRSLLEQLPLATLERATGPLPAPVDLASSVSARLASCGEGARDVVSLAAVIGRRCRVAELANGLGLEGLDAFAAALGEAIDVGLLHEVPGSEGTEVQFAHALVRAAVYQDLSPVRRMDLHGRAAGVSAGAVALAHRAAAAFGPDAGLAAELERSAREHMTRGRLRQAASELERSLELSVDPRIRRGRLLELVETRLVLGDVDAVGRFSEELASLSSDPWSDYVRGYLAMLQGKVDAEPLLTAAWNGTHQAPLPDGAPADLEARVASQLAILAAVRLDDAAMVAFGEAAVLAGSPEPRVAQFAWFARLIGLALSGRAHEALSFLEQLDRPTGPGGLDALVARGMVRLWSDDLRGAHAGPRPASRSG
jgi:hypothetical protein